jgi:hypothetical protein
MDIKEFKEQIKFGCHFTVPSNQRKKCIDTMMCKWHNCQKEQQDSANSQLTEEEHKSCKNKNFSKELDCANKLAKKKGFLDKAAALAHCTANKCPQIRIFKKKAVRELIKSISKSKKKPIIAQREKCMQKHCSKEVQDRDNKQIKILEHGFDCEKKFATYKEQIKCISKISKQAVKAGLKANSCRIKHCDIQPSNSNKKNNNKNKNTKKQTKAN